MRCWFTILTLRQNSSPCILVASKKIQGTGVGWQGYDHNFWMLWWWTFWRQVPLSPVTTTLLLKPTPKPDRFHCLKTSRKVAWSPLASWQCSTTQSASDSAQSAWTQIWTAASPLYSPNLVSSDFFLFPKMKRHLCICQFETDDTVIDEVVQCCHSQEVPPALFWGHSKGAALVEEVLWTCGRPQKKILRLHGDSRNLSQVISLPITPLSYISERKLTGLGTVSGHLCCQTDILHNSCI